MRINGITVCVNYSDLLEKGLARWRDTLERCVVATSPEDEKTQAVCARFGVATHVTDVFYANMAKFNKGAALSEAIIVHGLRDDGAKGYDDLWLCAFDADIVPPADWRCRVESMGVTAGKIYGGNRYWMPENSAGAQISPRADRLMPQGWPIGYFLLFATDDPRALATGSGEPAGAVFDCCWPSAGCYDTEFTNRWPKSEQLLLPIPFVHLGQERQNWTGRGDAAGMAAMMRERGRHGGRWEHERITPPAMRGRDEGVKRTCETA